MSALTEPLAQARQVLPLLDEETIVVILDPMDDATNNSHRDYGDETD